MLEIYIPRGSKYVSTIPIPLVSILIFSREGDRIVLEGEADQVPDQQPGDIVFILEEVEHPTFRRAGADLTAPMEITLAESLCGFSRVVIKHLDGRGVHINHPQPKGRVLKPSQVIKVAGEGMPYKKSDMKGDLYLVVRIQFPEDGWLDDDSLIPKLQELLPKPGKPILADTVDEVEYDETASMDGFGAGSDDARGGAAWVDEDDDEDDGTPQCAQQ